MHFDCAIHGRSLQPKQGAPVDQMHLSTRLQVFCTDLRLEVGGKAIAAVLVRSIVKKKWDTRPPELYLDLTKVLMPVGLIDL